MNFMKDVSWGPWLWVSILVLWGCMPEAKLEEVADSWIPPDATERASGDSLDVPLDMGLGLARDQYPSNDAGIERDRAGALEDDGVLETDPAQRLPNRTRFMRIHTSESPSWVAWYEIEVYVDGENIAPGALISASSAENGAPPEQTIDGNHDLGWNAGGFPPATITLDLGEPMLVERVRMRVQQNPPGFTDHTLLFGTESDALRPVYHWRQETAHGNWLEYSAVAPPDAAESDSILDPQRAAFWANGEVRIEGNRFMIGDRVYYPKTDFLTPVAPGDNIVEWNTLNYFAYDQDKRAVIRNALIAQKYNSIYLYTLTEGVDFHGGGTPVSPYGNGGFSFDTNALNEHRIAQWKAAVEELIAHGIKPVIWLAGDDSRLIAGQSFNEWQTYVQHMVDAFEEYPIMWVVGLEADEYWSVEQVRERTQDLKQRTRHPVGVHLTIAETRNPQTLYRRDADYIMAQFASPQDDAAYIQDIQNYHMPDVPWVAAEYNVSDTGNERSVTRRSQDIGYAMAQVGNPPILAGLGNGVRLVEQPPSGRPDANGVPFELNDVVWLHVDVSQWPVTSELAEVQIDGGRICLDYDKRNTWPSTTIRHNSGTRDIEVVANPWVFLNYQGTWYGATWEWLTVGSTCKNLSAVAGDHIKQFAHIPENWRPQSGERLFFMVSGLARFPQVANIQERTNIVEVVWP